MREQASLHHVLVLDDDEVMHDLLELLLFPEGCGITKARTGEEALLRLKAGVPVDLVLTDLHLPGLEGTELVRQLRAAMRPDCLLIGMSGSKADPETRAALDAFLRKPFDLAGLREAVDSARQQRGVPGPETAEEDTASYSPDGVKVLDPTVFESLKRMIPAAKLGDLFQMMLADIAKRRERILEAAAAGDLHTAQREAHAIKGSCGMVGATELHTLAAAIEGGTTLDVAALDQIPAACERLRRMLEAKLHTS